MSEKIKKNRIELASVVAGFYDLKKGRMISVDDNDLLFVKLPFDLLLYVFKDSEVPCFKFKPSDCAAHPFVNGANIQAINFSDPESWSTNAISIELMINHSEEDELFKNVFKIFYEKLVEISLRQEELMKEFDVDKYFIGHEVQLAMLNVGLLREILARKKEEIKKTLNE